jgi:hypothetical protein
MFTPLQPPPGPFASQETLFEWLKANCQSADLPAQIFARWSYPLSVTLKYRIIKVRDACAALAADPINNPARGGRVDIIVLEDVDSDCTLFHLVLDTAFNTNKTGEWITGISPLSP